MQKIVALCLLALLLATPSFAAKVVPFSSQDISLKTMIGQMIMVGFRGEGATAAHVLLKDIKQHQIGGVILFEKDCLRPQAVRNIVSKKQVRDLISALQDASNIPLFVAIDQEGGRVSRFKPIHGLGGTPSAQKLGELPVSESVAAGERTGAYLKDVGINMDFAPVLDVNVNPNSPVIGALERSFSDDPAKVATYGHAFAQGMAQHGIIAGYKHFPGHGSSLSDSHKGLPDITTTWSKKELLPYSDVLGKEPQHVVMVGHLYHQKLDADFPTSLSRKVVTGLLREELNYGGVVVTDDLQMRAITNEYSMDETAIKAVQAGCDILLVGNNLAYDPKIVSKLTTALMWAVHAGEISIERIRQSYDRIMNLKRDSGMLVEDVLK
ncbi:glycoside hydrolase family 3 protein [Halodesulfovibrio marinisediminis]|uniref:Beta-N-acetylhexosaminidase n=1 Tax=Halodesulfovibrio marinisediminis DSM 17456 TaxID=1121457 RepID=A0A1N6DRD4_9BACT|nr:glycoside hydrolase family 3 N-terminal domain-containing protein [Halodesulfovibrio marinisediminis]SIN73336.1 beta-N-acetylhexosaminidase [Halodesulfovibrio marinisediminis DSM 17456]